MTKIETFCPFCKTTHIVELNEKQYDQYIKWKNNLIRLQQINASADIREMLSTGICPDCWDKYFDEVEKLKTLK